MFNGDLSIFEVGNTIKIKLPMGDVTLNAIIVSITRISDLQYKIYLVIDNESMESASLGLLLYEYDYELWFIYRSGVKMCELKDGIVVVNRREKL